MKKVMMILAMTVSFNSMASAAVFDACVLRRAQTSTECSTAGDKIGNFFGAIGGVMPSYSYCHAKFSKVVGLKYVQNSNGKMVLEETELYATEIKLRSYSESDAKRYYRDLVEQDVCPSKK